MGIAISSLYSATPVSANRAAGGARASVDLHDKLSRCQQQLGDWQACPSRKTPEGKKIIQDLQTQIRNLETRIGNTGSAQAPGAARAALTPSPSLGRSVDVFA